MIRMVLENWRDLPEAEQFAMGEFFNYEYPNAWSMRRFVNPDVKGLGQDMEIDFTDAKVAMLFKLRWGGK